MVTPKAAMIVGVSALCIIAPFVRPGTRLDDKDRIATGKGLHPTGSHVPVGGLPINMVLSPDGRFIVVSGAGYDQNLTVLSAKDGRVLSSLSFNGMLGRFRDQIYFGIAFEPPVNGEDRFYCSRGAEDRVSEFAIDSNGVLRDLNHHLMDRPNETPAAGPNFVAGLALSPDGKRLYAANSETYYRMQGNHVSGGKGTVSIIDTGTGTHTEVEIGGFALSMVAAGQKLYACSELTGSVYEIDPGTGKVSHEIKVGEDPEYMLASQDGKRVYVSNGNSDTISVVDTARGVVESTILLRPATARALPGATPQGLWASRDGKTLFVALANLNAVAVVDLASSKVSGYIPVGWYPTSVVLSPDGKTLFVANGKGTRRKVPNKPASEQDETYIMHMLMGTVSSIDLTAALHDLRGLTNRVLADNSFTETPEELQAGFINPKPKHVFYIIKENRTYDHFFGDITKGNGDPSLCFFPKDVTPNQHALAERFGLLDNFYVCGEVSPDGWDWSTAAMTSPYSTRNIPANYNRRAHLYDFEGLNSRFPVDDLGLKDVARPAGGYLWDQCAKQGISFRNYGCFVTWVDPGTPFQGQASKKVLRASTDEDFHGFDMEYPDSDAHIAAPRQLSAYGKYNAASRFSEWKREFDGYVKRGDLPRLTMMRLPRDHTGGTAPGLSSPRAMVADNDYALGEIVDTISHSPYWASSVICVLEDDAQAGQDHVDCHRSPALVIGPTVARGNVVSKFYNTDSMLRTIELMLGIEPMTLYDAYASPIAVFTRSTTNAEPYNAIPPAESILSEVNTRHAYRASDGEKLFNRYEEEAYSDFELNDILRGDARNHGQVPTR